MLRTSPRRTLRLRGTLSLTPCSTAFRNVSSLLRSPPSAAGATPFSCSIQLSRNNLSSSSVTTLSSCGPCIDGTSRRWQSSYSAAPTAAPAASPSAGFNGSKGDSCGKVAVTGVQQGSIAVTYSPGSGATGDGLALPTTVLTGHCDVISETLSKADELIQQKKAQEALGTGADILTAEGIDEMVDELKEITSSEVEVLVGQMRSPAVVQQAGMHELRRSLYYATSLKSRDWIEEAQYTALMRVLTVEFLRRDNEGVLAPDDVLYVTTHMIAANFYNRHLWNRMERALMMGRQYETIDMAMIKALSTKLFKTRRGCPRETLDVRRKILSAMVRRVSTLANDFDLPSLLGILQCYTTHDMAPHSLQGLAVRATNHVGEFTPQECATLTHVLRKFHLLRLEVCERLVERICTADELNQHMVQSALQAIRTCYNQVSDAGRNALHAEPTRQKLRAMGEQVGCRLQEAKFPAMAVILHVLDIVVTLRIYVPKKSLQSLFLQAHQMVVVVVEQKDDLIDPATGKHVRPITMEQGRQLHALLLHYGSDLCPELQALLKECFKDGLLPDEASL
ncbi:putative mitochondrial mitochondrial RNA binding complex 1 subunit [Leptomonas pyrrhocoris]|uniref:Putative mitochondrial mitochondrial RNA binding complex 1 subunit n=1 Tax=Leptomonas pyrrhocoris TaxID=157538 RepID=A0A0M9GBG8_LEPPY|nr:putative mitochondrial mitochondrial RNA binding complex 1 subunit [Leptomonas pyrrhocoris]KPA86863.1 putative mitochondrial mitochondrial RNA binding complex 1 subunit [Leptomonas pyrrhocoris]|eukprot:XP_015665302.1 putative mitochondrial mitochondrial RNA binding complex 1 subunit [Leptomonas pyrrhocoris]